LSAVDPRTSHDELLIAAGRDGRAPARWIAWVGSLFLVAGVAGAVAFDLGPARAGLLSHAAHLATFGFVGALYLGFLALGVGLLKRPRQGWFGGLCLVIVVLGWTFLARRLPPRAVGREPGTAPVRLAPAPR
jgi:hypothetical protein